MTTKSLLILLGAIVSLAPALSNTAQTAIAEPAVSYPNDGRFLRDRIDFRLKLNDRDSAIDVSARPGQMTYISFPVPDKPGEVRKYAIVLMPESEPGNVAKDYSQLKAPEAQVSFTIALFCLEEKPTGALLGEPIDPLPSGEAGGCRSRRKDSQLYDDVRFLLRQGGLGGKVLHSVTSLGDGEAQALGLPDFFDSIQIIKYTRGQGGKAKDTVCLTTDGVDVCGCRVAVGPISSRDFCKE